MSKLDELCNCGHTAEYHSGGYGDCMTASGCDCRGFDGEPAKGIEDGMGQHQLVIGGTYWFDDNSCCVITDITDAFIYYRLVPDDGIGRWRSEADFRRGMTNSLIPSPAAPEAKPEPPSTDKRLDHCPSCGYTQEDAGFNMDHHLCKNSGNAPWEKKTEPPAAKSACDKWPNIPEFLPAYPGARNQHPDFTPAQPPANPLSPQEKPVGDCNLLRENRTAKSVDSLSPSEPTLRSLLEDAAKLLAHEEECLFGKYNSECHGCMMEKSIHELLAKGSPSEGTGWISVQRATPPIPVEKHWTR